MRLDKANNIGGNVYQVFVSHKTQELHILQGLVDALSQVGIDVYIAERDPWPGHYLYDEKIIPEISASDCMLVLLTFDGAASPDVNQEIGIAHSMGKPIIALIEEGVPIRGVLNGREVIYFNRLDPIPSMQSVLDHVAQLAQSKEEQAKGQRQAALAVGGIALLFLLGGLRGGGNGGRK